MTLEEKKKDFATTFSGASAAYELISENEADEEKDYGVDHDEQQLTESAHPGTKVMMVNRTSWNPKKSERFMMCAD